MDSCFISMRIRMSYAPVGRNIHRIMDHRLEEIQNAMEDKMRRITIADVMADANKLIEFYKSLL